MTTPQRKMSTITVQLVGIKNMEFHEESTLLDVMEKIIEEHRMTNKEECKYYLNTYSIRGRKFKDLSGSVIEYLTEDFYEKPLGSIAENGMVKMAHKFRS
jgi:hypothetical protein